MLFTVTIESFYQLLREEGIQNIDLASNSPMLQSIANKLREWKPLARFLGLDEPTITTIERNHSGNFSEQKFQMLNTWTRQNGREATLVNLLQVIYCDLNNRLLVEEVAQIQRNSKQQLLQRYYFIIELHCQASLHIFLIQCAKN